VIFPDLEPLLKKVALGRPHGLTCTLGPDGMHRPHTYFWGTKQVEVVCSPSAELGFSGLDLCEALDVPVEALNDLPPEDCGTITVWRRA